MDMSYVSLSHVPSQFTCQEELRERAGRVRERERARDREVERDSERARERERE